MPLPFAFTFARRLANGFTTVGLFPHAPHGPPAAHTTATATATASAATAASTSDLLSLLGRGRAARGLADTTDGAKLRALQVVPPRSPGSLPLSRASPTALSPSSV